MTISIIIPVYKVEKYIQRCLKSVIAQECDDFDIECILVDDCSNDISMVIAKDVIDHYHGQISFRIISNSENQGPSVSRNNGLINANGDYIFSWIPMIIFQRIVCHVCIKKSIILDVWLTW